MNMDTSTNTTKVKEIIEKYQHDSLFSLSVDKFSFDITANDRNISYIYINSGWVWELARPDANTIHTNYDGEISWDTLDEKIVLKLGQCNYYNRYECLNYFIKEIVVTDP
jgi:hypothetical protein